jgi:ubiquinone/menaquinone biosynthesis C-methylase UbiE
LKAYTRDLVNAYDRRHFGGKSGAYIFEKDLQALQALIPNTTSLLLDIPCGTGIYMSAFDQNGYTVVGADASLPMLEMSRQRAKHAQKTQSDINHLPFRDDSFDAVISIRLFSHFEKDQLHRMLNELRRVIRPRGRVIFDTFRWSPRHMPLFSYLLEKSYMYPIAPSEVEALISDTGLHVVDTRQLYLFSPLWQRKLPLWLLKGLSAVEEKVLPGRWLLRTFWACTKDA